MTIRPHDSDADDDEDALSQSGTNCGGDSLANVGSLANVEWWANDMLEDAAMFTPAAFTYIYSQTGALGEALLWVYGVYRNGALQDAVNIDYINIPTSTSLSHQWQCLLLLQSLKLSRLGEGSLVTSSPWN